MKRLYVIIAIWVFTIACLLQLDENRIMKNRIKNLEIENNKYKTEIENLKSFVQEYQNRTERIIDTNMKLLTEGGWNEYQNENN